VCFKRPTLFYSNISARFLQPSPASESDGQAAFCLPEIAFGRWNRAW